MQKRSINTVLWESNWCSWSFQLKRKRSSLYLFFFFISFFSFSFIYLLIFCISHTIHFVKYISFFLCSCFKFCSINFEIISLNSKYYLYIIKITAMLCYEDINKMFLRRQKKKKKVVINKAIGNNLKLS